METKNDVNVIGMTILIVSTLLQDHWIEIKSTSALHVQLLLHDITIAIWVPRTIMGGSF
jgi:hypothetical protein